MRHFSALLAVACALLAAGCAGRQPAGAETPASFGQTGAKTAVAGGGEDDWDDVAEVEVHDPIEPVNRGVFWFNHQLYTYVAKPFSSAYKFIFPDVVRRGVRNAY